MVEYIRIAVLFVAGIYLGERISPGFAIIFFISLIMVLTFKAVFKHQFDIKMMPAVLAFVLGVLMFHVGMCEDLHDLSDYNGRYITLTGRVCEIPEQADEGNVQYVIDVRKAFHKDEEKKIRDKILLTAEAGYRYGETIQFSGITESVPDRLNENGFDFARYYRSRDIFFKMYSENVFASDTDIKDYSPISITNGIRDFVSGIIDEHYEGDYNALMKAMLTGNKKEFSEDFDKILTKTGTKRFFYPAFLHVMLFLSLITFALSALKKKHRDIATVFLLIIYAMCNCSSAVFLKLCIVLALLIFIKSRFGYVYYVDVIGMTAIIMGVINPLIYFNACFVISILSSVMVYYFFDFTEDKLKFIKFAYVRRTITLGIICTVGLITVAAYFFNYVSPYSIFLALIMYPCVAVTVILSPFLILMFYLFNTAPIISQAVKCMIFVLRYTPIAAQKLSLTGFTLAKPDMRCLVIYLFAVATAVKLIKGKHAHARITLFITAALICSAAVTEIRRMNSIEINFVNVGQGDGMFISAPHSFSVLIDGGGGNAYSDYNPGEKVYLEYLKTEGITIVDSAFVSHYHQDHVQGIIAAMENIKVKNLFLPDEMEGSEWRLALEETARQNNVKVHYIKEETLIKYKNGMVIHAVPPVPKTRISDDENDTTYVYYLEYGNFSAVLTGDMSAFAEGNLIEAGAARDVDLLKVAHHGSRSSTSREWVEAVKPEYAVISVGEDNSFALPNDEPLEVLKNTKLYRTDKDGDIHFEVRKNGKVKIHTYK